MIKKTESVWRGYKRYDFVYKGHNAIVCFPNSIKNKDGGPAPWVWRAEFFAQYDEADMIMLERGYYLLHYSISDMYGDPEAVRLMKGFYDFAVREFKLSKKTILIGLSRGGLYAVNYTAEYPETVAALYLDAPVLDVNSWPRGKSPDAWEEWKIRYGLTDETAWGFKGNPLDKLQILTDNDIPVFLASGDADTTVPLPENGQRLIDFYLARNKRIKYIIRPGQGHHPHGQRDQTPVCDFLEEETKSKER